MGHPLVVSCSSLSFAHSGVVADPSFSLRSSSEEQAKTYRLVQGSSNVPRAFPLICLLYPASIAHVPRGGKEKVLTLDRKSVV